jgi:hypothetical protein
MPKRYDYWVFDLGALIWAIAMVLMVAVNIIWIVVAIIVNVVAPRKGQP